MKPGSTFTNMLIMATAAVSTLALVSWGFKQTPQTPQHRQTFQDTVPVKKAPRDKKVRDLDQALEELDNVNIEAEVRNAMQDAQLALKNIDMKELQLTIDNAMKNVDVKKINADIELAMKNVDMAKIKADVDLAFKNVDIDKALAAAKDAVAKIDWDNIKVEQQKALADASRSMKDIDLDKIKAEVDQAMKGVDVAKIQAEVANSLKSVDMVKIQEQIASALKSVDMEKTMASLDAAKLAIESAKAELKEYKSFVDGLDQDGLINKKENYTIEHKSGDLIINGKKASAETIKKYKSFLDKHPKISIHKDEDDFNIDED
jgi:hypothetical protein